VQKKFLQNVNGSAGSEGDAGVFEGQPGAVAISLRDIQIRNAAGGEVAEPVTLGG